MFRAIVVYTTRGGNTRKMAKLIAKGLESSGVSVDVYSVTDIKDESALKGYDIYVFGSPTYNGAMMKTMETFLFLAEKAGLEGKVGGAFGAYGWSGEAPDRMLGTMKNVFGMKTPSSPLKLKVVSGPGEEACKDYAASLLSLLKS